MRAQAEREIIVRARIEGESGDLTDADSTPTIVVTDGDGNSIAGVSAVSSDGTGAYKAVIPAQVTLDVLDVTWTAVVGGFSRTLREKVIVVSERLVPFYRLKEDAELSALGVVALQRLADQTEEWFKLALGFPAVVEPKRATFWLHHSSSRLRVPGAVYPVSIVSLVRGSGASAYTYTASDLSEIEAVGDGFEGAASNLSFLTGLQPTSTFPAGRYRAHITHGLVAPDEPIRRAAAVLARHVARTSRYPERAARVITQDTEIFFSFPSAEKPTGLPEVDAVLNRYSLRALV